MDIGLTLEHQLCFAMYSASRATQAAYREPLAKLELTYPQYLVLLVLWDSGDSTVQGLGERLYLDSGTLSPMLRRMEARGLVGRRRGQEDGRVVTIHLTDKGRALKEHAAQMQSCMEDQVNLTPDEITQLRTLAFKLRETEWNIQLTSLDQPS